MISTRRVRAACGLAAALVAAAPAPARAANLYVAWKTGHEGGCAGDVEDFWACVIGATAFNDWLVPFPGGETVTLVAAAEIGDCGDWGNYDCVVQSAGWEPSPGDVVEYIHGGSCVGSNWHDATALTSSGVTVPIRGAELGDGFIGNCHCQTALGMHEIYEAAGDESNADCCNGQAWTGCPPAPPSTGGPGWYDLYGCAGLTLRAQAVSPAGNLFDAGACMYLSVDASDLCAQNRPTRDAGACVGGDLETCSLSPVVTSCGGLGCDPLPAPHCNTFAGTCSIAYDATLCSGEGAAVTVTCTNTGAADWPAGVTLGSDPPDQDSLFADASWSTARVVGPVTPDPVPAGGTGTFSFVARAPTVLGAIDYVQRFGLLFPGSSAPWTGADPAALTMNVTVAPCAPGAGLDAGASDAGDAGGGTDPRRGCGCSVVGAAGRGAGGAGLLALAALAVLLSRRARRGGAGWRGRRASGALAPAALAALAAGCVCGTVSGAPDAGPGTGTDGGPGDLPDAAPAATDSSIPAGTCWMVLPPVACGDGVCDPGCENGLDCPADCALPPGGIPCDGTPAVWTCNADGSARYECYGGSVVIEPCGGPGACVAVTGGWPAQCHGCYACDGWYNGLGLPYLYTCSAAGSGTRRRCVDVSTGGDCLQGVSNPASCCAIDDDCAGGACISMPEGTDDLCP